MKKRFVPYLLIALLMGFSQIGCWETVWEHTADGGVNRKDVAFAIARDEQGSLYVAGAISRNNHTDLWIRKLNAQGNILWTRTVNGPSGGNDRAKAVALDHLGNVFVAGSVAVGQDRRDIWIGKYNRSGRLLWSRTASGTGTGPNQDQAEGLALSPEGDLYVIGSIQNAGTDVDIWIRKYNTSGSVIWTREINTPANQGPFAPLGESDRGRAITVSKDGSVYTTGYLDYINKMEWERIWIAKLDSTGHTAWTRTYNSPDNDHDHGNAITTDLNGNILVAGRSVRKDVSSLTGLTGKMIVLKYSPTGRKLWEHVSELGNGREESANDVAVDSEGNIYLTGMQKQTATRTDIWIQVFDSHRSLIWETLLGNGTQSMNRGHGIIVDPKKNIYVVGERFSPASNNDIWTGAFQKQ